MGQPKYFVKNVKELEFLEEAYNNFKKNYSIKCNDNLIFEKNPLVEKSVHITPEEDSKIEEIIQINNSSKFELLKN